jgi:ribosomal protein S18 acetylase RimI-like enzyme
VSAGITIRPFAEADAEGTAELLRSASSEYVHYFRPFEFERDVVERLVRAAREDRWFAIEIARDGEAAELAGFYMLRGIDEGFAGPMYGIFIAEEYGGLGLARLSLAHAEAMCRLNRWPNLLLKVDPGNTRAFGLYEASGFRFLRLDPATGNQVLIKPLSVANQAPLTQSAGIPNV